MKAFELPSIVCRFSQFSREMHLVGHGSEKDNVNYGDHCRFMSRNNPFPSTLLFHKELLVAV
jgi:hypothetical protein